MGLPWLYTGAISRVEHRQRFVCAGRLAPQDYHRFHTPVAGTITHISYVLGSLFSVSADAAVSKNAAFLNQRHVLIINSPEFGTVAYVAVGATCVGSTVITRSVGDTITKVNCFMSYLRYFTHHFETHLTHHLTQTYHLRKISHSSLLLITLVCISHSVCQHI